jgi:hypothetical protein
VPAVEQKGRQFDLPYRVEQWNDADTHVEELIALTGDYRVARAAYEEAIKRPARTHCCVEAENESVS